MTARRAQQGRLAVAIFLGVIVLRGAIGKPLRAASADDNAGTWQMIVLTGPTQIAVAAPGQVTSLDYQAELTAIRNAQSHLTDAQRALIDDWGSGGVLRWNEILLGLVARADLPPAPNADDTYPVPDANNPFADPRFPFSNPPYAARAYSYVRVAQFEALKAAWYYKFLYNRPQPSRVDANVRALVPATDLPAYPSEDAVLSGVTAEILKQLFPASVEEITLKAGEQRQAALLSGKATASDARGEIPWRSQDIPPRPPMLPLFGSVRSWLLTPADVVNERPGPPPSTSSALMQRELAEVRTAVDHLTREQLATVYKWADSVSTPTPPGHWNFIAAPHIRNAHFSEVRAARAFALLNMAMHDAAVACWDAKFLYFNPRPSQLDPEIRTVIGLPNFPAYVSGHSTFSAAADEVLSYLFPSAAATFDADRDEAAMSRLYGGIHYRSDIEVGLAHGQRIGRYAVQFGLHDGAGSPPSK